MNKQGTVKLTILAVYAALNLQACGYYHEVTPAADSGSFSGKETLGFEVVKTIFARNRCFDCHSAERGNRAGINLETYANSKPLAGLAASTMASGFMPMGGPQASARDIEIVQAWVTAGAPETSTLPLPGGDTPAEQPTPGEQPVEEPVTPAPAAVDFARVKAEIFTPHCVGCHASFATYARVASRLGEIQRAIDTNEMPKGGPPLSSDLKQLLNEWITAGAPEVGAGQNQGGIQKPGPGDGDESGNQDDDGDDDDDDDDDEHEDDDFISLN